MKTGNIISAVAASLLLIACGGNSSVSDTTTPSSATALTSESSMPSNTQATTTEPTTGNSSKIYTGYYVDAAVVGVDFNCTTQSGTTDINGTFTFEDNETCVFSIGGVVLREVNASSLEDNVTIFENNLTVAQFLQTLDSDGNASNGIDILPEAHELLEERNSSHVPQNDAELVDIRDELKVKAQERYNGDIVSEQDAIEHLEETRTRIRENNQTTQDDVEENRRNPNHNEEIRGENNLPQFDTNQTLPTAQAGTRPEGSNAEEHSSENNVTRPENNNQGNNGEDRPDNDSQDHRGEGRPNR